MTERKKSTIHFGILLLLLTAIGIGVLSPEGMETEAASIPKPAFTVTKRTKTTATIKIKKKGTVTGYQIWTSTSKNGTYKQVDGIRTRTCKLKKLKSNKVYFVKIRAFRTTNNYRITYGKFSAAVKIGKYQKPKPTETPDVSESPVPGETEIPEETVTPVPEETELPGSGETANPEETVTPVPGETETPVKIEVL